MDRWLVALWGVDGHQWKQLVGSLFKYSNTYFCVCSIWVLKKLIQELNFQGLSHTGKQNSQCLVPDLCRSSDLHNLIFTTCILWFKGYLMSLGFEISHAVLRFWQHPQWVIHFTTARLNSPLTVYIRCDLTTDSITPCWRPHAATQSSMACRALGIEKAGKKHALRALSRFIALSK